MYYIPAYWSKLCEEGRWINYIFFPILKIVPAHFAILCIYVIVFYYFFSATLPWMHWRYALVFALAGLHLPSVCDLLTWPVTGLPSFLVLAGLVYLKNRLSWYVVLAIGGILFHGTMNNFYNLLPLLYIKEIYNGRIAWLNFILGYTGFYITGFAFSEIIVFAASGSLIQVGDWRGPHYIRNFNDLIFNILHELNFLKNHFFLVGKARMLAYLGIVSIATIYISLKSYVSLTSMKTLSSFLKSYITIGVSMVSAYVQAIPIGIYVSVRTIHAFFAGLIFLPALIFQRFKILSLLLVVLLSTQMFLINMGSLKYYHTLTTIWYENLIKIRIDPKLYKLLFISSNKEVTNINRALMNINRLNYPRCMDALDLSFFWASAAHAAGFQTIVFKWKDDDPRVSKILSSLPAGEFMHNEFYRWRIAKEWLIIGIDWPGMAHKNIKEEQATTKGAVSASN